ncbi:MAG: Glycosyl transferase [Parachlamydiales bacterium]|nr:Glycosyl transferase [Parachlamydiales bacterium]
MMRHLILMIAHWTNPFFLWYFTSINVIYTVFMIIGAFGILSRRKELAAEDLTELLSSESMPEFTFVIPVYNESENVLNTIFNLLNLTYRYKKLVIINDGSIDKTFDILLKSLELIKIPQYFENRLPTQKIRAVYQSKLHPEIIVLDKDHGGKFDAQNAGVNALRSEYFISVDADTFIEDAGFEALIRPILTSPETIAVGAGVRIVNSCTIEYHRITTARFPQKFLPAFQEIEYLRSFMLRQGLSSINGVFVIAGAFGVFSRHLILQVGGYCNSVSEDMEIIIRLHHYMKKFRLPYKIEYLPDPVAWTIGPSTLKSLGKQRSSWHFGILESLWHHKRLFFNPFYGFFGLFIFPFAVICEAFEPVVECIAWIYVLITLSLGLLNVHFLLLLLMVSFGYTIIYAIFCLLLEELSFRRYPSMRNLLALLGSNLVENIGYRQITVYWRLRGFWRFFKEIGRIRKESKRLNKLY